MKTWSLFLKDVLVHVPGCPEVVAEHALLRAAQEFFETTRLWRLWVEEDMVTEADVTEYEPFLDSKTEIVRLETAVLDGRPIEVRSVDDLPVDWRENPQGLCTGVHIANDRKTIVLLPPQAEGLALNVELSMKPSETALGVDDVFYAQFVRQIAAGAVCMLKEHTDKSYSDPNGALAWRARFDSHMATADFQRHRGFSSARPRRQIKTF